LVPRPSLHSFLEGFWRERKTLLSHCTR
jgi:hypothetical protein